MRASDVMSRDVATVSPEATIEQIVETLMGRHISAVPVVDGDGNVVGIVSEGDLMRREELGTDKHRSWWLQLLGAPQEKARDYLKSHGLHARDVMTRDVVTVSEDADLSEIADLLESRRIKRVPVVSGGRLTGIVSRADLLRGLAAHREPLPKPTRDDDALRDAVKKAIDEEVGLRSYATNVIVTGGTVHLWGAVEAEEAKSAMRVAAERVAGDGKIEDHLTVISPTYGSGWI